jgi:hypothetical protein
MKDEVTIKTQELVFMDRVIQKLSSLAQVKSEVDAMMPEYFKLKDRIEKAIIGEGKPTERPEKQE